MANESRNADGTHHMHTQQVQACHRRRDAWKKGPNSFYRDGTTKGFHNEISYLRVRVLGQNKDVLTEQGINLFLYELELSLGRRCIDAEKVNNQTSETKISTS